jgi:hypothetical protein
MPSGRKKNRHKRYISSSRKVKRTLTKWRCQGLGMGRNISLQTSRKELAGVLKMFHIFILIMVILMYKFEK